MKVPLIIIPQSRLLLRFCVKMLFCQVFLLSAFISSQTLFLGSDSIIYISEEASFYRDSQTVISFAVAAGDQSPGTPQPIYHKPKTLKAKLKALPVTAYTVAGKAEPSICFTTPVSNEQFSNPGGFPSQAVTGDYFFRKLLRQIISPGLPKLHGIIPSEEKSFGLAFYPIRVIKISLQQYSRPPPVI